MTAVPAEDHHVHSTFSEDATSSVAENIAAARARGLRVLCVTDHVRSGTTWVPEFVAAVRMAAPAPDGGGLAVRCGVEAKLLDGTGRLDLPGRLPPLDRVLVADHQYPGVEGPLPPAEVRHRLAAGQLTADQVVDTLVLATVGAPGAVVEVNEKWRCPGPAAVAAFRAAGVPVVPSTDSHRAADVGVYHRVPSLLRGAEP